MPGPLALAAYGIAVSLLVGGGGALYATQEAKKSEERVRTAIEEQNRRDDMTVGELVRLRSDHITVYRVVSANEASVVVRHVTSWSDLEKKGCEKHIRHVDNPRQRVWYGNPYAEGTFPGCLKH